MVVLPVLCSAGVAPEWFMIELQGEIECREQPVPGEEFNIGQIGLSATAEDWVSLAQNKDMMELKIGYHQLEGRIVSLTKPVAMLEKRQAGTDIDMEGSDDNQQLKYEVVGVIRRKCIFKTRPRALISKPLMRGKTAGS